MASVQVNQTFWVDALDKFNLLLTVGMPWLFVHRWRWFGVFFSTIWIWASLVIAGMALDYLSPTRDAAILDHVGMLFGWLVGLVYSGVIFGALEIIKFQRSNHKQP